LTIDGSALNPPLTLLGGTHTRIIEVKYPAKVTIAGLVLTGGTANSGNGGAVYVESEFTAINSTFSNNKAINGGAIWGGRVTLIDSTLTQNIAAYDGGAVGGVILDIRNTTIQSNEAYHDGGGIAVYGDGSAKVVNSTIFGNQAGNHGGGFFATGYTLLNIVNSTFAENTAVNGHEFMLGETRQVDFINTIFVCNAESEKCYVPAGNTISNTNSILGTGTLQDYELSEPADNGGPTHTMALLPGSTLIDAGDDTMCADSPVNNLDQRGVTRPQGSHCDIGAYEYKDGESMIQVAIGNADAVSYPAVPHKSQQQCYPGV
jgi:predicted outer membrane repeat protein